MLQYQHKSRSKHKHSNSMPRNNGSAGTPGDYKLMSYKTQRLPRSADPSPQRTVERIESLGEKHGGIKYYAVVKRDRKVKKRKEFAKI